MMKKYFLLLALFAVPAAAQTEQDIAEMMKLGTPGPHHKALQPMLGTWTCDVTFVMGGQEGKGTAEMESKWVLGGRFLHMEYKSDFMGAPFTVIQYLGFDNSKKEHIELMMDSMATDVVSNRGSCSDDCKTITHYGTYVDPLTKKPMRMRTVYKIESDDKFVLEWWQKIGDGEEEKTVTIVHTRKK